MRQRNTNGATQRRRVRVNQPTFRPKARDFWLGGIGLAIFWFVFNGPPVDRVGTVDLRFGLTGPGASNAWKWLGALLLVAMVVVGERRPLASMLLTKPSRRDLEWVIYAFGAVMTWSWVAGTVAPQENNRGVADITAMGVLGVVLLILTAAITEEVAYRGYLQERFGALTKSRWIGAIASLAIFVVPHVVVFDQSWLVHQLPGTLALVGISLYRRNLPSAMLLHLLINAPILIPTIAAS